MNKAFVLGAGLGTRLRPLTDQLPKPLIPVFHRPLMTYAFDHLLSAGLIEFIVNTHHLPECYEVAFPKGTYREAPITFRNEPVLLETAGGIANITDLVADESFIVYNGDILTDLPLQPLIAEHERGENIITLVLRSTGPAQHIAFDAESGRVTDIRGKLNTGNIGTHQFTGIYAIRPDFLKHLEPGKKESVIPIFLKLIESGERIGAVVVDQGVWWDLGDRESYLEAHQTMHQMGQTFPAYGASIRATIQDGAAINPHAVLKGLNVISVGAEVGEGAVLEDCILWPDAKVAANAKLTRCVVRSGIHVEGVAVDQAL
jgi:mannose-1-phosphate guanylyltransferase/mannose-1-phosphate guanylyltransferase/phosphomannomutase